MKITMKTIKVFVFFILISLSVHAQDMNIQGLLDWDRMEFSAVLTLDIHRAGIRLPAGRSLAESLLEGHHSELIRPMLMGIQADSSTTLADLVNRGEVSPASFMGTMRGFPPALSRDQSAMSASYSIKLHDIGAQLVRHSRTERISPPLIPVPARDYTGIIIIIDENLPVHGRSSSALALPCLFPKIWDNEMNLIFERNMMDAQLLRQIGLVQYTSRENITRPVPSALDDTIIRRVGENPLRIMALGLFGAVPTDPIIDREDALTILSSENNRQLLSEGRIVFVLNRDVLRQEAL